MSSSIEEELWNIFTYYSMHGNPRDPSKMNSIALVKFCRDIMVSDESMTEKLILPADVHLLFASEIKKNQMGVSKLHQEGKDKLNYEEFLSCLTQLALKVYPSCVTAEEATQQLLMDNILPLALRRQPKNIKAITSAPQIEAILNFFIDPLKELFQYFSSSTENRAKVSNIIKTTSKHTMTFDEHKEDIEYRDREKSKSKTETVSKMQYNDFVRFSQDFGLVVSLGLTNLDIADIFLTVTAMTEFSPELGRFDYKQFCEALVRCALTAYDSHKHISPEDKLKAMFLCIWRHIQSNMQQQLVTYNGIGGGFYLGHTGGFVRGAQMFNERFIACWSKDSYLDYLEGKITPGMDPSSQASNVMSSLLGSMSLSATSSSVRSPMRSPSSINPDSGSKKKRSPATMSTKQTSSSSRSPKPSISSQLSNSQSSIAASKMMPKNIKFDIDDADDVGDARIKPADLKKLLATRPDIAEILYSYIKELNIEDSS